MPESAAKGLGRGLSKITTRCLANGEVMQLGQGLVGPFISSWLLGRHYRKLWKRQVFAQLVGNRHLLTPALMGTSSHEPYIALNQAFVAFADSPSVIDALRKYHSELDLPGRDRNTNNLVALIKEMAKSAGVRFDRLDESFITHPFTPPRSPESESQGDLTQDRQMAEARSDFESARQTNRRYGECAYQAGSWPHERRVIVKAEVTAHVSRQPKDNPRFVVTNLKTTARHVYGDVYCTGAAWKTG